LEKATKAALSKVILFFDEGKQGELADIQVQLLSENNPMEIRLLQSSHVSKLVKIPGIVISSSRIQARAVKLCIECRGCHKRLDLPARIGFGGAELPKICLEPENPFVSLFFFHHPPYGVS